MPRQSNKPSIIKQSFGRLLVLRRIQNRHYECFCECGNITLVAESSLRSGATISCGCYASEHSKSRHTIIPVSEFPIIVYKYISSDKTLDDIGKEYKVSRERIRQIISKFGDIHKLPKPAPITPEERTKIRHNQWIKDFWMKVDVKGNDDCWEWTGGIYSITGYGRCSKIILGKKIRFAHIASYILNANQPIPDGLWVLHTCDNVLCVNPNHLYLGTPKDNAADRENRNRYTRPRGKGNLSKFSLRKIHGMFCDYVTGKSIQQISVKYDVSSVGAYLKILRYAKTNHDTQEVFHKFKSKKEISLDELMNLPQVDESDKFPRTSRNTRNRSMSFWKQYSKEIAKRDGGYFCKYCGIEIKQRERNTSKGVWGTIDHVHPLTRGGNQNDISNMVLSCNICNSKKSNKTEHVEQSYVITVLQTIAEISN